EDKEIEEEKAGESGGSSSTISEGDDLGEIVVPSTPKSKMKKKLDEKVSKDDENVMQTPLSKLNRIPTRKNEKLAALLEKSLKTQSQQLQSKKRKSLPVIRGRMQSRKSRNSLPSSSSAPSLANIPRTRSARVNLNERFAMMDRLNEGTNACAAATTSPAPQTLVKDISLDKSVIERYRKRIEAIRHSTRKSDKNEVFYGRCTSRRNLFDDSIDEEDSEGVATRSTACIQKNRSGRSVQTSQKVYMAHALLNVYNTDPLNPPKLPKDAPFKLHRLIRPASKSDKKRLFKLRLRIAREKSGSASSLVKNNTCEIPVATDSSKDVKAKSEIVEENSSNESEKFEAVDRKEILESDNSEKTMDLFRDPGVRKLARKLSGTSKNIETDLGSSNRSSRKSSNKKRRNSSYSSHSFNGISSNNSKISDSNGSIINEKISTKAIDDISEMVANPCISSAKSESADNIKNQMRKVNHDCMVDKIGSEGERGENSSEIPSNIKEKDDKMNVL
ncbi:unnamed protein product, partial [Wuchereria bancrofti]